ncbi:AI-2E family transporter [Odoribacter lunatus]|uniref:AI-2E family transporter n=1 Tax=Odoribacter lunatus TaxID=2941335 RepID=UPI002041BD0C|nr:AI-2E family transporter [Odoribacter lunatus]
MSIKERYWNYSLIVIILLLGTLIFLKIIPFLGGILGALTVYILVRPQMIWLSERKKFRRSFMAILILCETIFFFLIPLSLVIWLLITKLQAINLQPQNLLNGIENVADMIREKTGYELLSKGNVSTILSILPRFGQMLMEGITSFAINVLVMLFVLYFMLIGGKKMEKYVNGILPFNRENKKDILQEFHRVVRSNAIGVPLLAVIQGGAAMLGYFIFGVPSAFLWGVLSCFATIIPIIGTAIIWIPLFLYLGAIGHWGNAIGLVIYSAIVIGNVDNLIRGILQKKMADTHPLVTIFGVVIGLSLFGFMGVIFGPLLLSLFILCVEIFREDYLKN